MLAQNLSGGIQVAAALRHFRQTVILDLGLKPAAERKLSAALTIIGVIAVAYGIWLNATIVSQR
jgi:hypothetical protein